MSGNFYKRLNILLTFFIYSTHVLYSFANVTFCSLAEVVLMKHRIY